MLDPSQNVVIGGAHLQNRSNVNVQVVRVVDSNTPFVIQQIFTTFSNMYQLEIINSQLQTINISDAVQLEWINILGNNISRIENGTFTRQLRLTTMDLSDNNIQEIQERAFEGLTELNSLDLVNNSISNLAPQTFYPLTRLRYLHLEANNLSSISAELFSQNYSMRSVYLKDNKITQVSPRFSSSFGYYLNTINMEGNLCVNRRFVLDGDEFSYTTLHNFLRSCYHNFSGSSSDNKSVILGFNGYLRLFDEYGNLVGSM